MRRALLTFAVLLLAVRPALAETLAVCADPSNLPYSNEHEQGFENRIARLLAEDQHASLRYRWAMERRGFLRRTLLAGACDVVISVPSSLRTVAVTRPYFTSSYVFVTARARSLQLGGFDDPALRGLRLGLQLVGAEGANTPPSLSLARRGLVGNVTGFPMWDAEEVQSPQGRIVDAVALGTIDAAIVWGPFAGYFAKPYGERLTLVPVAADPLLPSLSFTYAMSMGVRPRDEHRRERLQDFLDRRAGEVRAILEDYAVPLVPSS